MRVLAVRIQSKKKGGGGAKLCSKEFLANDSFFDIILNFGTATQSMVS